MLISKLTSHAHIEYLCLHSHTYTRRLWYKHDESTHVDTHSLTPCTLPDPPEIPLPLGYRGYRVTSSLSNEMGQRGADGRVCVLRGNASGEVGKEQITESFKGLSKKY